MASNFEQDAGIPTEFEGPRVPTNLVAMIKWGAAILGLILLFVALNYARSVYTDWLWFDALGFKSVFVKVLFTRIVMFFIGAVVFGALLGVSMYFANRLSQGPVTLPMPPEAVAMFRRLILWGIVVAVIILSIIFGAVFASNWEAFLKFSNSVSFQQADPIYGKDVSFYVFSLPILNSVHGWLLGGAIMVLVASLALYFVNFSLRGVGFEITPGMKVQVSIIVAITMFILAWGHWLDRWELVLSGQGAVFGGAYADIHARKPALLILTIIAAGSGVLMLVNAYLRGIRLLIGAAALWMVMAVVLAGVWPATMQRFTVGPNEFKKESPYIARNIEFTRRGYALDRIQEEFYQAETAVVTDELIEANLQTIYNIRLWDHRPLADVYRQIQLIRPYYDFKGVDVDRYTINGEYRQVLLSAREVAPEKLVDESQTWLNQKLFYTHGIGLAMSPVTDFTPEGRPEFFAKDIPANGVIPIGAGPTADEADILVTNPRIYYGENTTDYVIVKTKTNELDYQTEEGELIRTNYAGTGGVHLSSFVRRVAYAWELADINVMISGEITGDSLVQYRRAIQDRVSTVAPFLLLDGDPYIVATDEQFFWIQDAYTVSDHYPYSDPIGDTESAFNYIRNSVKVTVDAYNGDLSFYIWDTADPLVRSYAKIFPDLFLPAEDMPQSLRAHVRYPQDFFTFQAQKHIKYHMRDPENFYNNEDLWAFANEKFGQAENLQLVEPYYVIMRLPEEEREEFVLLLPYTPNQRQNLIGWLAARSDGDNYGKLVAFNFPKDRQVDGPEQVEARIDNDQDISAWFTLRCAQGATCIRGNLLVIPVGNSILYAEPVYIQAEGVTFPELKRVILATGDKVVMEDSLDEALAALIEAHSQAATEAVDGQVEPTQPADAPASPVDAIQIQSEIDDTIQRIKQDLISLQDALERLKGQTGGE